MGTTSPYSYFGLGEVNFRGTQINRFMGGLEIYNDSIHANLSNPSSYAKLKLTTYSLGLNYRNNNLTDTNGSKSLISSGLDYIGLVWPGLERLAWTGLDGIALDWTGVIPLDWLIASDWIDCIVLD